MKDYYETLGVKPDADANAIKIAYRKLAMQYHPDRNPGDKAAELKFKEIGEAHDTLKDEHKKSEYDMLRANPHMGHNSGFRYQGNPGFGGMNIEDIIREMQRQNGNFGGDAQNRNINVNFQITLEEAFEGKETDLNYMNSSSSQQVHLKIPPGCPAGVRIRYQGKGDHALKNVPPGDLFVMIHILPHAQFVRHGNNLATSVTIDYIDAMLGTHVEVPTIDGTKIRLAVPEGIVPGQSLRAAKKGMKDAMGNRGDMFIEVVIIAPTLNVEQKKLLSEIKAKIS